MFRHFELARDELARVRYREATELAFDKASRRSSTSVRHFCLHLFQFIKYMREIQCINTSARHSNSNLQLRQTKDALFWLIDHLNLTQIIEERSSSSPVCLRLLIFHENAVSF